MLFWSLAMLLWARGLWYLPLALSYKWKGLSIATLVDSCLDSCIGLRWPSACRLWRFQLLVVANDTDLSGVECEKIKSFAY